MAMSIQRRDQLLQGQRVNAQRIYNAIPISECWNLHRLIAELTRLGMTAPVDVIQGCLRSLSDAGLIRHDHTNHTYIRTPVRELQPTTREPAPFPQQKERAMTTTPVTAPAADPAQPEPDYVHRLGNAADALRAAALVFNRATAEVADELENLAVSLSDRLQREDPELVKLRNLATALKALA